MSASLCKRLRNFSFFSNCCLLCACLLIGISFFICNFSMLIVLHRYASAWKADGNGSHHSHGPHLWLHGCGMWKGHTALPATHHYLHLPPESWSHIDKICNSSLYYSYYYLFFVFTVITFWLTPWKASAFLES